MSISGNTLVDLNDSQNRLTANIKITEMGNALSALTIGIMWDLQGYPARALAAFNDVKDRVRKIPGQKDNEVIYFFIGREYLMQKQYDQAKDNFTSAIGINPDYALAHIGLGGVYFARAALIPAEASQKADLQNAVNEYTLAINKAPPRLATWLDRWPGLRWPVPSSYRETSSRRARTWPRQPPITTMPWMGWRPSSSSSKRMNNIES